MTAYVTAALRSAHTRVAGRPWLVDVALGGGLTAFDMATLSGRTPAPSTVGVLLWGLQTVPLFWRRRRPRTVLGAMTVAFVLFEAIDPVPGKTPGPYFLIFAVYALARYAPAAVSAPWSALSLVAAAVTDLVGGRSPVPRLDSLEPITATTFAAFYVLAWLLGYGRRRIESDAGRLRALNERLRVERETNARQAVLTERARIARDLHDVVAHHVSAIAVQARSTEEVLRDGPALADVTRIAETADTALIEMRRILGLLSGPGEDAGPEPSLAHVDRLVSAAEAAGCRVTATLDPSAGAVPSAIQVSAYRIVQEALTNVVKHAGPTDVRVALRLDDDVLTVEVENGPAAAAHRPVPGSGRGLIGVRERVTAFGGTSHLGPRPDGGWRVRAALPLREVR
ncbi:sensor histidine kinase [Actinoallomurus iriomotensis]|uniref:histidine kinase n=1 Tax=Actinoallomurus iriomotensis TaxID=478107 RepID=A0A9W6RR05_9ACTN|nr:histidine kinase [Actinoallomurus iriomotensis]GLY79950.1 ATPase [Actinoallomurus iriomotensis]